MCNSSETLLYEAYQKLDESHIEEICLTLILLKIFTFISVIILLQIRK